MDKIVTYVGIVGGRINGKTEILRRWYELADKVVDVADELEDEPCVLDEIIKMCDSEDIPTIKKKNKKGKVKKNWERSKFYD